MSGFSDGSDFIVGLPMKIGLITKDEISFETPFQGFYCRITYCVEYDKGIINGLFYIAGWVVAIALPLMLVFLIFRFYFIWTVLWTIIFLHKPELLPKVLTLSTILYFSLLALHILILFYISIIVALFVYALLK